MLNKLAALVLLLLVPGAAAWGADATAEQRTTQALDAVRADPLALRAFLAAMPKGADLHNHLDGAVYAETFIRVGAEDGLCIDQDAKALHQVAAGRSGHRARSRSARRATFPPPTPSRSSACSTSWSIPFPCAASCPSEGITGHDHFFGIFAKFGGTDPRHTGEFLDEVATRAAAQNEQYLELMETPTWHRLNDITKGWLGARISARCATS